MTSKGFIKQKTGSNMFYVKDIEESEVPDIDITKIKSDTIGVAKQVTLGDNLVVAPLLSSEIPDLDMSKITTGSLDLVRIVSTDTGPGVLRQSSLGSAITVSPVSKTDIDSGLIALPSGYVKYDSGTTGAIAKLPVYDLDTTTATNGQVVSVNNGVATWADSSTGGVASGGGAVELVAWSGFKPHDTTEHALFSVTIDQTDMRDNGMILKWEVVGFDPSYTLPLVAPTVSGGRFNVINASTTYFVATGTLYYDSDTTYYSTFGVTGWYNTPYQSQSGYATSNIASPGVVTLTWYHKAYIYHAYVYKMYKEGYGPGGGISSAPSGASYITISPSIDLTNETPLDGKGTGNLKFNDATKELTVAPVLKTEVEAALDTSGTGIVRFDDTGDIIGVSELLLSDINKALYGTPSGVLKYDDLTNITSTGLITLSDVDISAGVDGQVLSISGTGAVWSTPPVEAPIDATYLTITANGQLTNEVALDTKGTGVVRFNDTNDTVTVSPVALTDIAQALEGQGNGFVTFNDSTNSVGTSPLLKSDVESVFSGSTTGLVKYDSATSALSTALLNPIDIDGTLGTDGQVLMTDGTSVSWETLIGTGGSLTLADIPANAPTGYVLTTDGSLASWAAPTGGGAGGSTVYDAWSGYVDNASGTVVYMSLTVDQNDFINNGLIIEWGVIGYETTATFYFPKADGTQQETMYGGTNYDYTMYGKIFWSVGTTYASAFAIPARNATYTGNYNVEIVSPGVVTLNWSIVGAGKVYYAYAKKTYKNGYGSSGGLPLIGGGGSDNLVLWKGYDYNGTGTRGTFFSFDVDLNELKNDGVIYEVFIQGYENYGSPYGRIYVPHLDGTENYFTRHQGFRMITFYYYEPADNKFYTSGSDEGTSIAQNSVEIASPGVVTLNYDGYATAIYNAYVKKTYKNGYGPDDSAPTDATYITLTSNDTLTAEEPLDGKGSGLMRFDDATDALMVSPLALADIPATASTGYVLTTNGTTANWAAPTGGGGAFGTSQILDFTAGDINYTTTPTTFLSTTIDLNEMISDGLVLYYHGLGYYGRWLFPSADGTLNQVAYSSFVTAHFSGYISYNFRLNNFSSFWNINNGTSGTELAIASPGVVTLSWQNANAIGQNSQILSAKLEKFYNPRLLTWEQTFDFSASSHSTFWTIHSDSSYAPDGYGVWESSVGYRNGTSTELANSGKFITTIKADVPAGTVITGFDVVYSRDADTSSDPFGVLASVNHISGSTYGTKFIEVPYVTGPHLNQTISGSGSAIVQENVTSKIYIEVRSSVNKQPYPDQKAIIHSVTIRGTGYNPFV